MIRRDPRRAAAAAMTAAVCLVVTTSCGGDEQCADPVLRLESPGADDPSPTSDVPSAAAGASLTAIGSTFASGCTPPGAPSVEGRPRRGLRLYLVQGSSTVSVAQLDAAGPNAGFSVTFGVPPDLRSGPAEVRVVEGDDPDAAPLATAEFVVAP